MSSVPVSLEDLELIISQCARDLLESWAIESDLKDDELPGYAAMAAETAAFVVEHFMYYLNSTMFTMASDKSIIS
jgi:hypothetical protein